MEKGFVFDVNKCVTCHACMVACSLENREDTLLSRRQVDRFNPYHIPRIPLFSLSLACNHCENAPCMKACPAEAYYRDPETQTVQLNSDKCMGCKYCTWACPYDAPKYNPKKGIIEKCTLCAHKLENQEDPACVPGCPTGALRYEEFPEMAEAGVRGFPETKARPMIRFIPLRRADKVTEIHDPDAEKKKEIAREKIKPLKKKLSLQTEWSLWTFTSIVPFLTGIFAAGVTGKVEYPRWAFYGLAIPGLILSMAHLGKPLRAFYAIKNLRTSWLSREIFFFGAFLLLALYSDLFPHAVTPYVSILAGIFCLVSIDGVYHMGLNLKKLPFHSAQVWITGVTVFAYAVGYYPVLLIFLMAKFLLYMTRGLQKMPSGKMLFWTALRVAGLLIPLWMTLLGIDARHLFPVLLFFTGEIIDRAAFYNEFEIESPKRMLNANSLI